MCRLLPIFCCQPEGGGQLVVGTEDCRILLLNPSCTSVSSAVTLPAVPALISPAGSLEAAYRVLIAARDGWVYSIKGGALSKTIIQLDSHPVAMVRPADMMLFGAGHFQVLLWRCMDHHDCYWLT